jgi:glutaminyl-tRNA synthetase
MSKPANSDPNTGPLVLLFKSIGLSQAKALEAVKAPKSAATLKDIIESHQDALTGLEEKTAALLANLAVLLSKAPFLAADQRDFIVKAILDSRLKSIDQISGRSQVRLKLRTVEPCCVQF